MRDTLLAVLFAVFAVPGFAAPAPSDQQIVNRLVPSVIEDHVRETGDTAPITSVFTTADLGANGGKQIVAVYVGDERAALEVINPAGGGSVLAVAATDAMFGRSATVQITDIDRDGKPEIIVLLRTFRSLPAAMFFKWTGSALLDVTPLDADGVAAINDPTLMDVDGDGKFDVIDHKRTGGPQADDEEEKPVAIYSVFRWNGAGFEPSTAIVGTFLRFSRGSGAPITDTRHSAVADPSGHWSLVIRNGDENGGHRVSSGTIALNGSQVVAQNQFSQSVATLNVPVSVAAQNDISVKLAGSPGGEISVVLIKQP